ncbi:hypothetical protein GCM10027073_20230 [Streptomyces chlorus]
MRRGGRERSGSAGAATWPTPNDGQGSRPLRNIPIVRDSDKPPSQVPPTRARTSPVSSR